MVLGLLACMLVGAHVPAMGSVHIEPDTLKPYKVRHAEPIFIDLIRDLGAHKGEREWNVGFGAHDKRKHTEYELLVEYEWAVIDRLGLEIEVPVTLRGPGAKDPKEGERGSRVESLKLAAQYTFLVSEKTQTSLALGYIHELEFSDFKNFGRPVFYGNLYNPFFVAAQRIGQDFHSLIYTGPRIQQPFAENAVDVGFEMHSNLHYMFPRSRHFVGVEVNKYYENHSWDITFRPQVRIAIGDHLLVGVLMGIPTDLKNDGYSVFTRIIWEPRDRR
ncbi:MAG: phosphoribosylformylglycinamidine synthase [Cryomorphaceae bacterium]|nr:MAG: phosphoribosylformylglycinamidine synthase [Cryomorphaceae bacterium]